jgi:hypothetical protein
LREAKNKEENIFTVKRLGEGEILVHDRFHLLNLFPFAKTVSLMFVVVPDLFVIASATLRCEIKTALGYDSTDNASLTLFIVVLCQ